MGSGRTSDRGAHGVEQGRDSVSVALTAGEVEGPLSLSCSANPMVIGATIYSMAHHYVVLEFDVPSFRLDYTPRHGQRQEADP